MTARRVKELPQLWQQLVGSRRSSAATRLLDGLIGTPVFSASEAEQLIGGATSSVYAAIKRLEEVGVIRPLTRRVRNQVWGASDLLDEVEDLGMRIAAAVR